VATFSIALLFMVTLLASAATIGLMLASRWDAILSALAGEPIPERKLPVVGRRMAHMRAPRRSFRPGPTRQQLLRAAA